MNASDVGGSYERKFSCVKCGNILPRVFPPDDIHTVASSINLNMPLEFYVIVGHRCPIEDCRNYNTLYWYSSQSYASYANRMAPSFWSPPEQAGLLTPAAHGNQEVSSLNSASGYTRRCDLSHTSQQYILW